MKQQDQSLSLVAGANLKRLIKEANMTQEEAADKLLLTEGSSVRRLIRNGITKIDMIQDIAKRLDVPVWELLKPLD